MTLRVCGSYRQEHAPFDIGMGVDIDSKFAEVVVDDEVARSRLDIKGEVGLDAGERERRPGTAAVDRCEG